MPWRCSLPFSPWEDTRISPRIVVSAHSLTQWFFRFCLISYISFTEFHLQVFIFHAVVSIRYAVKQDACVYEGARNFLYKIITHTYTFKKHNVFKDLSSEGALNINKDYFTSIIYSSSYVPIKWYCPRELPRFFIWAVKKTYMRTILLLFSTTLESCSGGGTMFRVITVHV